MRLSSMMHKSQKFWQEGTSRMDTLRELVYFFWDHRLWWSIPFVVMIFVVGLIVVFVEVSPVGPFMYALF